MARFTLDALAAEFLAIQARMPTAVEAGLEKAAIVVESEAKSYPGIYQPGWPSLADSTIARKKTGDSPELETGALRDSIERTVQGDKAYVGSNLKTMAFAEFGTSRIPPRPIMSTAAIAKEDAAVQAFADEVAERTGLGVKVRKR